MEKINTNMVKQPYDRLWLARSKERPGIELYIEKLMTEFTELKGDRVYKDDAAIMGGLAFFRGRPVTVIGHRKGKTTEENIRYNFGMASPHGYRKAIRLMRAAEKFQRPVLCFVDTPGAYPGMEAEAMGQSRMIAESIATMMHLKVPVISVITGEGGSGGALALSAADRVYMMENAVYSVLSPEGFASIMWKDPGRVREACDIMQITSTEILEHGLIDGVLKEDEKWFARISHVIEKDLRILEKMNAEELTGRRYKKFKQMKGKITCMD